MGASATGVLHTGEEGRLRFAHCEVMRPRGRHDSAKRSGLETKGKRRNVGCHDIGGTAPGFAGCRNSVGYITITAWEGGNLSSTGKP
jgi:hypothetical protein